MEVFCSSTPNNRINFSSFKPNFTVKTRSRRIAYRFHIPISKFHKASASPCCLPSSGSIHFQIAARFGNRSRRRNYLRKKLMEDQKLLNIPIPLDPGTDFQNVNLTSGDKTIQGNDTKNDEFMESTRVEESKYENLGDSNLVNELENWVTQYKKEAEYWGIGSNPIFTVFQDLEGNVDKVKIDEDEILRRSRELKDLSELKSKIQRAKKLAEEMEIDKTAISRNSSVAKFVSPGQDSSLISTVRGAILRPDFIPKLSVIGRAVFCGFLVIFVVKIVLFAFGNKKEMNSTELEREMVLRKIKARKEKEILKIGNVEVVEEGLEKNGMTFERPRIDEDELMNSISRMKGFEKKSEVLDLKMSENLERIEFDGKIGEIREMARQAREIEAGKTPDMAADEERRPVLNESVVEDDTEDYSGFSEEIGRIEASTCSNLETKDKDGMPQDLTEKELNVSLNRLSTEDSFKSSVLPNGNVSKMKNGTVSRKPRVIKSIKEAKEFLSSKSGANGLHQEPLQMSVQANETPETIIASKLCGKYPAEEKNSLPNKNIDDINDNPAHLNERHKDNEFRSSKGGANELRQEPSHKNEQENGPPEPIIASNLCEKYPAEDKTLPNKNVDDINGNPVNLNERHEAKEFLSSKGGANELRQEPPQKNEQENGTPELIITSNLSEKYPSESKNSSPDKIVDDLIDGEPLLSKNGPPVNLNVGHERHPDQSPLSSSNSEPTDSGDSKNWMEKNFHEFEPIVKKIGDGFRDKYIVGRDKASQGSMASTEISQLGFHGDESEFEWMKDDKLRDIVFKVRDNELGGRDPFYLMNPEDKALFFQGLEKKVEDENEKLSHLHDWLHSNIENLDYGTDGISLYDSPEKIIPRWKGPPLEKNPEFLDDYHKQREALFSEKASASSPVMKDEQTSLQEPAGPAAFANSTNSPVNNSQSKSKTVIQSSDGSVRPGKKSGKEFWQHTKKWSSGFLELYNSEADPEVKAAMKDMGKDLNRWITEKEVQEAADLMKKLPERNKKFMEKKLSKLKREMELFGPQAVVSKYREYGDNVEEDYLWWLDLPHVLCIEMYTVEDGETRVGFYALEMATDLELEPKPHHVIAFQDAAECKNFHYIVQSHLEMLGKGNAFVVPQPPKEAFREAKANGFGVTVIRKGELKLNVDQTLEEVEEEICEIGSKMYHDKIMKDRSVDMSSLMKGVFGLKNKPGRRKRSKRMLKRSGRKES